MCEKSQSAKGKGAGGRRHTEGGSRDLEAPPDIQGYSDRANIERSVSRNTPRGIRTDLEIVLGLAIGGAKEGM